MSPESLNKEPSPENQNSDSQSVESLIFSKLDAAKKATIDRMQNNPDLPAFQFKQTDYEKEKYIEGAGLDAESHVAYEIMGSLVKNIPEGFLPNVDRDQLAIALAAGIANRKRAEDSKKNAANKANSSAFL